MGEIKDGGRAFPGNWTAQYGMTLRDWFAGQIIGSALVATANKPLPRGAEPDETMAKIAYGIADAMIAHREQKP